MEISARDPRGVAAISRAEMEMEPWRVAARAEGAPSARVGIVWLTPSSMMVEEFLVLVRRSNLLQLQVWVLWRGQGVL